MHVDERKALLRRVERKRWRVGAGSAERERRSRVIQRHFLRAFPPRSGQRIALYAAIRGEVDTDRIRDACLAAGAVVHYPVLGEDGELRFYPHRPGDRWAEGRFGLREPMVPAGAKGRRDGFDMIVVPGLAFDAAGRRLGQGHGSYDRLLSPLGGRTLTAGLAYSWQLVDEVPVEPWDVPVDVVVTEDGVIRSSGGGARPGFSTETGG